ncbi:MAG: hypothetical protein LBB50_03330, partial [Oscillospiraceae bacterium]|nr:hypothetical protein [Oscillospiraceae bacterium]
NKKKKEKPPKEKKEPEKKEEPDKPKEPNIFQRFYQYQGVPGFVELLWRVVAALQAFGRGLWRAFYIRRLAFYMVLPGGDDPAALAEKYGKLNAAIYPPLGWLMSHLRSRKGAAHVQLHPDFTGWGKKQMECEAELTVCPLVLIAALLGLLLRLGVRVGLKFLQGSKPPSSSKSTAKSIAKN